MCCRSEWQERMYIYKWHEVDQTKHEIFCVHIVCNEIQVKVNLEITTFFFYLRFPYCPNFFWFGVVLYSWMIHRTYVLHESERTVHTKMKILDHLGYSSCHSMLYCISVFMGKIFEIILVTKQFRVLLTFDYFYFFLVYLLTNILHNIFFCENDMRRSTWWHNFHFCVDYPLRRSQQSLLQSARN